jgi:hypothetical protein
MKELTKEQPKQETLEEAAEKQWGNVHRTGVLGFIEGAKWQAERSQIIVPSDATNIEVFAIKPDENGKLFAYIGYKISNGNFEFSVVPFTEPKPERMYSEEEVRLMFNRYNEFISHHDIEEWQAWIDKQFKKK